jgi:hypothetical protein
MLHTNVLEERHVAVLVEGTAEVNAAPGGLQRGQCVLVLGLLGSLLGDLVHLIRVLVQTEVEQVLQGHLRLGRGQGKLGLDDVHQFPPVALAHARGPQGCHDGHGDHEFLHHLRVRGNNQKKKKII